MKIGSDLPEALMHSSLNIFKHYKNIQPGEDHRHDRVCRTNLTYFRITKMLENTYDALLISRRCD